ncbi:MAG: PD-(D/E)XK nuclease family protein, partial [Bryobacteraceae bacterium]
MPIGKRLIRSRSHGKLLQATAAFLADYSEALLIAPSYSAGENLAHRSGGLAGLHRFTLVQLALDLARPAIAELGLAPLSSLGVEALAARVAFAARAEGELAYFAPVANFPGFARALATTLGELRMARAEGYDLASSGAPGADLAKLLARYEAELESGSLADLARIFELAAAVEDSHWFSLPLAVLDAPLETRAHRELFSRIASRAPSVLAAISSAEEVFEEILEVDCEDRDRASSGESSLEHLRKYLFSSAPPACEVSDGALELFSAPGEGLEAVEIARRILDLARGGTTFDGIAILLRGPERYQPAVEDALRRARIPSYFSRGTARPDAGGRAFLALLACASENCPAARFAEYLSLGQVPTGEAEHRDEWVPADDEMLPAVESIEQLEERNSSSPRAPGSWEKLLVEAAVIGGRDRWERRLRGLEHELELRLKTAEREDGSSSERLVRRLEHLRDLERFALPLIEFLDALPREARWKDWITQLGALARMALRRPEPVLAVLAEFEPMGEVGPASIEEVAAVLGERLRFLRCDPLQRRYGRVFVGSIEEARGREFAAVFLPGLAEGLFPRRASEDPLLLDDFRRAMEAALPVLDDRAARERSLLRLAAGAARERLIASYPRMDVAEARPRVPSFYALELPRAIEGRLPELRDLEDRARKSAPARLNWPAPPETAQAIDDIEYDLAALAGASKILSGGRYLIELNPALARSLRGRWHRWERRKWTEADGLIAKNSAALALHRLTARPWSPSSLQRFVACPYQFALHGIFGLHPREESVAVERMDPLTRGALFHEVQFVLLSELKARDLLPVNTASLPEALELCDAALARIDAKYREELAPAIPRIWNSEIEDLRTDLHGWLHRAATNDSEWMPVHFEFGFGLDAAVDRDPASTSAEADLSEYGVRLRGSIDLIERHASRGVLRVTDHKTGKPPDMVPACVGGGKFLQPLL